MKQLLTLFVILFTVVITYTVVAQEFGSLRMSSELSFPEKIQKLLLDPLPAGNYTVGTSGYFPTIDSAFNKLSTDGIAGEVTLELINNLYTAPSTENGFLLNGPIPGAGPNSKVTIKPGDNKNVIIQGDGQTVISFLNISYLTLDGVSLSGSSTLTIHSLFNSQFVYNRCVDFFNDSDHNTVQNIAFIADDYTRYGCGPGFWTPSFAPVAPDSNLIQYNFIKKAGQAIYVSGLWNSTLHAVGNIIRGNIIGSENDSLISWGIQAQHTQNTIIENNVVQNVRFYNGDYSVIHGINSYDGIDCILRNNIVFNIQSHDVLGSTGILLSGSSSQVGNNNLVYNNMVYDVHSSSTLIDSRVAGIQIWWQVNPKIYYNSIYLNGVGNGANLNGSAALYIHNNSINVDSRNNILVNTRNDSPYCASSIQIYPGSNLITSDYNDLFYEPNQYNCLVKAGGTNFTTLADWQVTGKDSNSITEMPNFIDPYLHIDETIATYLESRGTPIAGIETDFDGDSRNAITPDIGADEFNGMAVGVEDEETLPKEYVLEQNYPNPFNPSTKIIWQSPVGSHQTLKIYDILGNEIVTLVNEYKPAGKYEVEFNTSSLSGSVYAKGGYASGVYFYQLKAGSFVETKKMLLLK